MGTEFSNHFPFAGEAYKVNESYARVVLGFDAAAEPLAVKVCKPDSKSRVFASVAEATAEINDIHCQREQLIKLLAGYGTSEDFVPPTESVIHQNEVGEITYSEVQELVERGHTLADLGIRTLLLDEKSREDLANLFRVNLDLWKEGKTLDIVGSRVKIFRFHERPFHRLMPLFFSYNLVAGEQGLRYVDIGTFDRRIDQNLRMKLVLQSCLVGTCISLGILQARSWAGCLAGKFSKFYRSINSGSVVKSGQRL